MNNKTTDRIKVMIADDHPIVCSGLTSLIDNTPDMRVVVTAEDTDETIKKVSSKELDILVLDLGLPGAGGIEVLKHLRNNHHDLKILVLSLQKEEMYGELTIRLGAKGYLNKATNPQNIIEALREILRGKIVAQKETLKKLEKGNKEKGVFFDRLTAREIQVANLLIAGERNRDIAELLSVSEKTVNTHRTHIFEKLHVFNLAELIELANKTGFSNS